MSEFQKGRSPVRVPSDDEREFTEYYSISARVLYNLAVRILRSVEEAENALTDVYLALPGKSPAAAESGADAMDFLIARTHDLVILRRRARAAGRDDRPVDLESLTKNLSSGVCGERGTDSRAASVEPVIRGVIARCGSMTSAVVSHIYFGGLTVRETAGALSMTPAECRSRLHGCLDMIASRSGMARPAVHHKEYSVYAAAQALGALDSDECPEYIGHLAGGCDTCAAELTRYSLAAGKLAYLLPDVQPPPGLRDKILFSMRLARMVSGEPARPDTSTPESGTAVEEPAPEQEPVSRSALPDPVTLRKKGAAAILPGLLVGIAIPVACGLALYASSLRETIDRQSNLIESVQSKNTALLVEYDRFAGVSRFFESNGVVAVLEGEGAYPGLTGKIVWDTSGKSAMLQILNVPPDLEGSELEVSAVREGRVERLAGLPPSGTDSGNVLYRFFSMDPRTTIVPRGFTVSAVLDRGDGGRVVRRIMSGSIPDRKPAPAVSGRERRAVQ